MSFFISFQYSFIFLFSTPSSYKIFPAKITLKFWHLLFTLSFLNLFFCTLKRTLLASPFPNSLVVISSQGFNLKANEEGIKLKPKLKIRWWARWVKHSTTPTNFLIRYLRFSSSSRLRKPSLWLSAAEIVGKTNWKMAATRIWGVLYNFESEMFLLFVIWFSWFSRKEQQWKMRKEEC